MGELHRRTQIDIAGIAAFEYAGHQTAQVPQNQEIILVAPGFLRGASPEGSTVDQLASQIAAASLGKVVTFDPRGGHLSRGKKELYSVPQYVSDIVEVTAHYAKKGYETVSYVGYSIGGVATARAVAKSPLTVRSLVLMQTPPQPTDHLHYRKFAPLFRPEDDEPGKSHVMYDDQENAVHIPHNMLAEYGRLGKVHTILEGLREQANPPKVLYLWSKRDRHVRPAAIPALVGTIEELTVHEVHDVKHDPREPEAVRQLAQPAIAWLKSESLVVAA